MTFKRAAWSGRRRWSSSGQPFFRRLPRNFVGTLFAYPILIGANDFDRRAATVCELDLLWEKIMAGNLPFSEKLESGIGPEERWFSAAAGACLVGYGLSRISLRTLAAMAIGGYLVYRGSTGKCPIGDKWTAIGDNLSDGCQSLAERSHSCCGATANDQRAATQPGDFPEGYDEGIDVVDEASMESFPASDPPSHASASPSQSPPIS